MHVQKPCRKKEVVDTLYQKLGKNSLWFSDSWRPVRKGKLRKRLCNSHAVKENQDSFSGVHQIHLIQFLKDLLLCTSLYTGQENITITVPSAEVSLQSLDVCESPGDDRAGGDVRGPPLRFPFQEGLSVLLERALGVGVGRQPVDTSQPLSPSSVTLAKVRAGHGPEAQQLLPAQFS